MVSWIIAAVLGAAAVGFAFGFAVAAMEYAEGQCECVEVFTLRKTMVHAKPEYMAYEDHCEAVSEAMRGC